MTLRVHVAEARGLPCPPPHWPSDAGAAGVYAKLKAGKDDSATKTVTGTLDPVWNEELVFSVTGEKGGVKLTVTVYRDSGGGETVMLGGADIEIKDSVDGGSPTWFPLRPPVCGTESNCKDCGEILLAVSFCGRKSNHSATCALPCSNSCDIMSHGQLEKPHFLLLDAPLSIGYKTKTNTGHTDDIQGPSEITGDTNEKSSTSISRSHDQLEFSDTLPDTESPKDASSLDGSFEDAVENMQTRDETDIPENLPGGVVLEQSYIIEPKDLNLLLFRPDSEFQRALAQHQATTDYEEGPWRWKCKDNQCLSRFVTYTKAATKLVKAVRATEEQAYLKADGKSFAVLSRVDTPDVPYGNCFQVLLLYKITPGPDLPSGEKSSCLTVSWDITFHQSTIMRKVIEGSARQGLKESYEGFSEILLQYIKPLSSPENSLDKEQLLAPLQSDHQSDCKLFMRYFCRLTVCSTILVAIYVVCHILLSEPPNIHGLEFYGLDLPDSFIELIASGILSLQLLHVSRMISHFIRARLRRGSDHGIKGQGDGWLLTAGLMEGSRLPHAARSYPDPYVVFSCNGKSRTSSVQLQTAEPRWNEILEFDAMQEPPSVLDIRVLSFDGPFDQDIPLGHAEINFLKFTPAELADMWVPLEGKLAHSSESSLHLKLFVDNSRGDKTIQDFILNMEKEVGKKMSLPSSHKNSVFRRLFELPSEEFLIHEFLCYLKRKLPLQGKIFLSARIFGFYANFLGLKTKFFFLWEDIESIQEVSPSFTTVGSPALLIFLRNGRGLDARHGAKSLDDEGRLKFQFQSFASFDTASRTIMALWRSKSRAVEQDGKLEEDQLADQDTQSNKSENSDSILSNEEHFDLPKAYSLELPLDVNDVVQVFDGGYLENKIMTKVGCLNYSATPWVTIKPDVYERKISYKFNGHLHILGGEVLSTQQKVRMADGGGWIVHEVITIHNVPFGDHFLVHSSHQFESLTPMKPSASKCDIFVGMEWVKSTKFQKRIAKNIRDKVVRRSKEILELVEKELDRGF